MKKLALTMILISSSAFAEQNLVCIPHYMSKNEVGILKGFKAANPADATQAGIFGTEIVIPMSQMENHANMKAVVKEFQSEEFDGKIRVSIGGWYQSEKLVSLGLSVSHIQGKTFGGENTSASVEVRSPLPVEQEAKVSLKSGSGNLLLTELACFITDKK